MVYQDTENEKVFKRVLEVTQPGYRLGLHYGFVLVQKGAEEVGRVALGELECVVLAAADAWVTRQLIDELARCKIPLLFCDDKYLPVAEVVPLVGLQTQAERQRAQASASVPLNKQLWAALVKGKLYFQELLLREENHPVAAQRLKVLRSQVLSGDRSNREAVAAREYWPALFGEAFRRDPSASGINALLNYGYAILRSSVARALTSVGLLLGWGIGHVRRDNPHALCDDVMEPFRPSVDRVVVDLLRQGKAELDTQAKRALAKVLWMDYLIQGESVPLANAVGRVAQALAQSYLQRRCLIQWKTWSWPTPGTSSSTAIA